MPAALQRVPLLGSAYKARSLIASAQREVNLYPETNTDPQAPVPVTHYQTPGSVLFAQAATSAKVRCTYRTSIGTAYVIVGPTVYFLATNRAMVPVGTIADRPSQVIMADNGLCAVIVDGSADGWAIDLTTNDFGQIIDPAFYGAAFAVFLDTFFVFNRPATNQFYISLGMVTFTMLTTSTAFDPLDIAAKAGSADNIVGLSAVHRELWLIGELTTEVWVGTGSADFYFQLQQGAFIDHGCGAAYTIVNQDTFAFWLMQDKQGKAIFVQAGGYQVKEISTPALVAEWQQFEIISDAVSFCFQIDDHAFVGVAFPTANITYLYDLKTSEWIQWAWLNVDDGSLNRHRANSAMFFNGFNLVGDWETGIVWQLDSETFTDGDPDDAEAEVPIVRIKTFPHIMANGVRVVYNQFIVDMECGTSTLIPAEGDPAESVAPLVSLRWSDDRGKTYSNAVVQSAGVQGDYLKQISINRLGMARDRIFELSWSSPFKTALNGAFIEFRPLGS